MNGYVMNKSNIWMHTMKRAIGPGQKVPLDELYGHYGVKHGLAEGEEFVQWLRSVKLKDRNKWNVTLLSDDQSAEPEVVKEEEVKKAQELGPINAKRTRTFSPDQVAPLVPTKMGVADVVGLSVREARVALAKINDLNLLKYAYEEARQLAGKDSLSREIKKRIKALQIAR